MATIANQQLTLLCLMDEIKEPLPKHDEKDKRIAHVENQVSDLDQYLYMNDIVTGLVIKPWSYAHALKRDDRLSVPKMEESLDQQVTAILYERNISIDSNNIETCHPLQKKKQKKKQKDKPVIIFSNRKHKIDLLEQGRNLKGSESVLH